MSNAVCICATKIYLYSNLGPVGTRRWDHCSDVVKDIHHGASLSLYLFLPFFRSVPKHPRHSSRHRYLLNDSRCLEFVTSQRLRNLSMTRLKVSLVSIRDACRVFVFISRNFLNGPTFPFTIAIAEQPPRKRARKGRNDGAGPSGTDRNRKGKRRQTAGSLSEMMHMPLDVFFEVRSIRSCPSHEWQSQCPSKRLLRTFTLLICSIWRARRNHYGPFCSPRAADRHGSLLLPP